MSDSPHEEHRLCGLGHDEITCYFIMVWGITR
uniref:K81[1] protein n=1 Tax=Drosophila melanogaster TaxID=7227 RepID=Q86CZ5_DROME|nr:K81[1] protein [Drosophila melanogaster]